MSAPGDNGHQPGQPSLLGNSKPWFSNTETSIKQRTPPYPQPLLELKLGSLFPQNLSQA